MLQSVLTIRGAGSCLEVTTHCLVETYSHLEDPVASVVRVEECSPFTLGKKAAYFRNFSTLRADCMVSLTIVVTISNAHLTLTCNSRLILCVKFVLLHCVPRHAFLEVKNFNKVLDCFTKTSSCYVQDHPVG